MRSLIFRIVISFAAAIAITAPVGAQTIAITGGKVYPVSGPPIEGGTVLIVNGKIVGVGSNVPIPASAQRIDATGKIVTPGFVNSSTQLGVQEVSQVTDTRDMSARGKDNIAAAFTVWDGLNPNSVMMAPARKEGITSFIVMPTGGLVAGQAALLDVVPGTTTDMIIRAPVAMIAEVGNPQQAGVNSRGELIVKLRELLDDTRFFQTHRDAFDRAQTRPFSVSAVRRSELTSSIWLSPRFSASTTGFCTSTSSTRLPASPKVAASGTPTYPAPMTATS
jgi:hypothetical protein